MSIVLKERLMALTARVEDLERRMNKPVEVVAPAVVAAPEPAKRKRRTPEEMAQARSEGSEV